MAKTLPRKAFGRNMRAIRKSRGISQEKLGDLSGLHRTYIGAVERGEQNVAVDNIAKIAKALKVKSSSLFTD